jgi:hypothetical protein
MTDPALAGRLGTMKLPALVLWGDSDRTRPSCSYAGPSACRA